MCQSVHSISLQTSSILHVPTQNYEQNFTFIVNKEEYQTSRIVADLLSPKIANQHLIDPTFNQYTINTKTNGNFNKILNLATFEKLDFTNDEIPFIIEIFENLESITKSISFGTEADVQKEESIQKVISSLQKHLEYPHCYDEQIKNEVDEISKHFYEMDDSQKKVISTFGYDIIEDILRSANLQVEAEDDVVEFINDLYFKDPTYCNLYSYVYFKNVSSKTMKEFIQNVNYDDLTKGAWSSLSERLYDEINNSVAASSSTAKTRNENVVNYRHRYKKHSNIKKNALTKKILYENQNFSGLIHYLKKESDIKEEIDISCSSIGGNPPKDPWNVFSFDDQETSFFTKAEDNSWICFEFKKHEIIPTNYTIRSGDDLDNPKSFVLEGSKDKNEWTIIDNETNFSYLKERRAVHTFPIQNESNQSFKYLRLRHIGSTWSNQPRLQINSIEFYGDLI